jgi:hypothetical protein
MTRTILHDKNLDLGKEDILEHLINLMLISGIDIRTFALAWQHETTGNVWILIVRRGKDHFALKFTEGDVIRWPGSEATAAKYDFKIRTLLEQLKARPRAWEEPVMARILAGSAEAHP